MNSKQDAQQYVNYIAEALEIIDAFPSRHNEIYTIKDFNKIFKKTYECLRKNFSHNSTEFLCFVKGLLDEIKKDSVEYKLIKAVALVLFLDERISYDEDAEGCFSLSSLVEYNENKPAILQEPLNINYKDTKICINPKFEASLLYELDTSNDYDRRLFNRDAFWKINGKLNNCSYFRLNENISVTNIVVPISPLEEHLRFAFSPLIDKADVLITGFRNISRNQTFYKGEYLKKIKYPNMIEQNFRAAWNLACENNVNIFFAPEMLCTKNMNITKEKRNLYLKQMASEQLKIGTVTPCITILPSYWHEGSNNCQILYRDGRLLGKQFKKYPCVEEKSNSIEALKLQKNQEIIVIHIPGFHRIVTMICSDFLTEQEKWLEDYICKQLQATLIVVPSFSSGEQDFINSLSILKRYGTSVIWGNCCSAKLVGEKQIGGCGIVGTDNIQRFKDVCTCNSICHAEYGCIFIVDVPLKLFKDEPIETINMKHILHCDKL